MGTQEQAEFRALCERLTRNDPFETTVRTGGRGTPLGFGRRLGLALVNNTVVTMIEIKLTHLLSKAERKAGTIKAATPLLQWIEQSATLNTVKLTLDSGIQPAECLLLQGILKAMASNPYGVRALEWSLHNQWHLLTKYLRTSGARQSLERLHVKWGDRGRDSMEAAARAIGELPALKIFTHSFWPPGPILRALCSHAELRQLFINFRYESPVVTPGSMVDLLCSVLRTASKLRRVTVKCLDFDTDSWNEVSSALQSNASIVDLKLEHCQLTHDAVPMFLKDMHSNGDSQHIRRLHLIGRIDSRIPRITDCSPIGGMVCGSLLEHLTLDEDALSRVGTPLVFGVFSTNASAVQLRSLQLNGFHWRQLRSLATYLAQTIHLRRLTLDSLRGKSIQVPSSFLHSLRRNGSLHHVKILNARQRELCCGSMAYRFISAFTTRNSVASNVLAASMHHSEEKDRATARRGGGSSSRRAAQSGVVAMSPTLVQVAHPASRYAPNTLLRGLLSAAADSNDTGTFGGRATGGKRILDFE